MYTAKLPVSAFLLIITILFNCCTNTSREKQVSQMENDSIKSKTDFPDYNRPQPAAPGTANIKAWMQDFKEAKDQFVCKLKVEEVNGYGPATPPLPEGYVLEAVIPVELIKINNYPSDKIFVRGKLLQMIVRTQGRMPGSDTLMPWVVTTIHNLK